MTVNSLVYPLLYSPDHRGIHVISKIGRKEITNPSITSSVLFEVNTAQRAPTGNLASREERDRGIK